MEFISFFTLVAISALLILYTGIFIKETVRYPDFGSLMWIIGTFIVGAILGYTAYTINPFDIVFSIGIK